MPINRRELLKYSASLAIALAGKDALAENHQTSRKVPSSGEEVPLIGMGTWITFNVGDNTPLRDQRCQVLEKFFELGGRMVDSSPMYGSAEEVLGYCTADVPSPDNYLRTTKVWTPSAKEGRQQIANSFKLWKTDNFGLYQVHNLVNWRKHLPYLQELKQQGKIKYVGVSTSHGRRHDDLADIMESRQIDFVQLTYNLQDRQVENRLLPLAMDKGIGVIVNRPFRRGGLFNHIGSTPLPEWAADIDCEAMAQIMLKFVVSHPAVTCAIPATSQIAHMIENMAVQNGPLPDQQMRREMSSWFDRI